MKVAVFSAKPYDRQFLAAANPNDHTLTFFEAHLDESTVPLVQGHDAVCCFVNDDLGAAVLTAIASHNIRLIALRCAGFNNVHLPTAEALGFTVVRVPEYSPYAVAEHTVGLMLALNRKIHRAYQRTREDNFSLDGLLGFDLHGRTVGIVGTGKIGARVAHILQGFGCRLYGFDLRPNPDCEALGMQYVSLEDLWATADVISLHCPLNRHTHHLIDASAIAQMKPGVMLVNTSRGGLIDTQAVIEGLKSQTIGYLGLDVYEQEGNLFFEDLSERVIQDDVFQRLLTFPNVLITGHQAFFTEDALANIAQTTFKNLADFEQGSLDGANTVTVGASLPPRR